MSRKPVFKVSTPDVPIVMSTKPSDTVINTASKWIPLICGAAAIGVSIFALKEIHNTRRELMNLKKEQLTGGDNEIISKKMEIMESQLSKITEYLRNQQRPTNPPIIPKKEPEIKPVKVEPETVQIINETQEDEYEEIEVTDDESD